MSETFQDVAYRNTVAIGIRHVSRGRPRSDRVHRAILDAARELLIRDGYTRLRLEHVAAAAGVGKATIYRRWPTKEDLAQALVQDLAAPHLSIEDVGDTEAEMLAAVMNPIRAMNETNFGPVIRALLSQIAGNPKLGDPFRETVVQTRRKEVAKMIERGIARGDICPDANADIATELLVGPVYFRLVFGGDLNEEFAHEIVDNVMRGYGSSRVTGDARPCG
ncbi:MAG TPA: TetR/AcrR family transcriptional regulator [Candidatus Limnocylindrales bacterium]